MGVCPNGIGLARAHGYLWRDTCSYLIVYLNNTRHRDRDRQSERDHFVDVSSAVGLPLNYEFDC